MLSVEINSGETDTPEFRDHVEIFLDRTEIYDLIEDLKSLAEGDVNDALHFFTEHWGGDGLSMNTHRTVNVTAHHLMIMRVADDRPTSIEKD